MVDLNSVLTYEPLRSLNLAVSRLLKTCLNQYYSLGEICSHSWSLPREQKEKRLVRLSLLKAFNSTMAHVEEYPVLGLHVDFAEKENSTPKRFAYERKTAADDGLKKLYDTMPSIQCLRLMRLSLTENLVLRGSET